MNNIDKLIKKCTRFVRHSAPGEYEIVFDKRKFAKLVIEETLKQVDERCYTRGENQWYYDDDKKWVRLHFGYGGLK